MAIITLTKQVLITSIVVSTLNAVTEEKGIGWTMGMKSKHTQEAEATNVLFSEVKGVNEAKAGGDC